MSGNSDIKFGLGESIIAGVVALGVIGLLMAAALNIGAPSADSGTTPHTVQESSVASEVEEALGQFDEDMRQTLASTSQYGYQGDIEKVEADGENGVKVHVSTYYEDSGDGEDGGKNIARKIFGAICLDVPELETMYVTSTSSGLDSRSVYRSDFPACS